MRLKLHTCVSKDCDYIGLNQVYNAWEAAGLVERVHTPMIGGRHLAWVGRVGGLALEPSNVAAIPVEYEYVLACQYRSAWSHLPKVLPWNFYARSWQDVVKVRSMMPVERTISSIFSGTIRGDTHQRNIWKGSTEVFSWSAAKRYTHSNRAFKTQADYYLALARSKFGLCPVGDCPVCQREIETMAFGCVPVFTPGVECRFFEDPVEGVHYLRAENPADMHHKIQNLSSSDRDTMSAEAMAYYDRRCTPLGLWDAVVKTIDRYEIRVD